MGRRQDDAEQPTPNLWARILGGAAGGTSVMWIAVFLTGLALGTYALWNRFGDYVLSQQSYQLTAAAIETTPQPTWIQQSDVKAESIQAGSLSNLNIRQEDLTLRVAQAFSMHPWVKKVKHVSKRYPAGVLVELDYRLPVAMVEVPGGRLPVDADGVLLPTTDFSAESANQYPRVSAGETTAVSNIAGTQWGDDRVHGAARLAAVLLPHWHQLQFKKVIAYHGPRESSGEAEPYFVLRTESGTTIIWGHAPGRERAGEPSADQKLARLTEFVQQQGGLDVLRPGQSIDLRHADRLEVASLPSSSLPSSSLPSSSLPSSSLPSSSLPSSSRR